MQPRTEKDPGSGIDALTYTNPVFPKSFPDPFVLKFRDEYFAYCTGFAENGDVFGILRSRDLVSWDEVGGAMKPLLNSPPFYWAPEVTYDNGKFYLYYSVGNETLMEIRVAVSDRPDGDFIDAGRRLTQEDFAIDAHVFIDDDGSRYLFYATDFLEHTHIGTGTVVDRMIDWYTLAGEPRPVTRAKYDWQVYDPNRVEKGGVRWHTVEGPAVLKRKGVYYEMFSGGNWKNTTYGVSFASSREIDTPDEWCQFSDGENVLPILRTIPDTVVGPGHNSVVRGPNNRELYCVYHRWTEHGRVMAIDRMDFVGSRIFVIGATHTAQPAPLAPSERNIRDLIGTATTTGDWDVTGDGVMNGSGEIRFERMPESFLMELALRCDRPIEPDARLRFLLACETGELELTFHPTSNTARLTVPDDTPGLPSILKLPNDFDWTADHTFRIELDHRRLYLKLDAATLAVRTFLGSRVRSLAIVTRHLPLAIGSGSLTEGFEELFTDEQPLEQNGWSLAGSSRHRIQGGEMIVEPDGEFRLAKCGPFASLELAANFRFVDDAASDGRYGLLLKSGSEEFRVTVDRRANEILVDGESTFNLPAEVDLLDFHQLRVLKLAEKALCYFDDVLVGEFQIDEHAGSPNVFCDSSRVAIEMIRVTRI